MSVIETMILNSRIISGSLYLVSTITGYIKESMNVQMKSEKEKEKKKRRKLARINLEITSNVTIITYGEISRCRCE